MTELIGSAATEATEPGALDDPVRAALAVRQARFARRRGLAWRFEEQIAPFLALPADPGPGDWQDAAELLGPQGFGTLVRRDRIVAVDWTVDVDMTALQMVATRPLARPDGEFVTLTAADVPEMLELVARTKPGPFGPRTELLGTYLGLRDRGELVAMAGERLAGDGWTELSAICTDPRYQGRGLATRLVGAIAALVEGRGDLPVLHVRADNLGAIRVYERLGFVARCELAIYRVSPPAGD